MNRLAIGFGMMPRGEVGLIFAGIGKGIGVVDEGLFSAIVLLVMVTTVLAPILLRITMGANPRRSRNSPVTAAFRGGRLFRSYPSVRPFPFLLAERPFLSLPLLPRQPPPHILLHIRIKRIVQPLRHRTHFSTQSSSPQFPNRKTFRFVDVTNTSSALNKSSSRNICSIEVPASDAISINTPRVIPSRHPEVSGGVSTLSPSPRKYSPPCIRHFAALVQQHHFVIAALAAPRTDSTRCSATKSFSLPPAEKRRAVHVPARSAAPTPRYAGSGAV